MTKAKLQVTIRSFFRMSHGWMTREGAYPMDVGCPHGGSSDRGAHSSASATKPTAKRTGRSGMAV